MPENITDCYMGLNTLSLKIKARFYNFGCGLISYLQPVADEFDVHLVSGTAPHVSHSVVL